MAVVMQHFSATAQTHAAVTIPSLVPHGYMAVHLFFVLSGFIMAYTYQDAFTHGKPGAFLDFLGKRVARIVPLNIAVLASIVVLAGIGAVVTGNNAFFTNRYLPFNLLCNILMLQGLGVCENMNGPSWSISTEFAAYLFFPVFVLVVFHRRRFVAGVAMVAAAAVLVGIAVTDPRHGLGSMDDGIRLAECFTQFVIGMGVYRLYRDGRYNALFGKDAVAFAIVFLIAGCLVLRMDLPAALLFPALILSLACNHGWFDRILASRIPYFVGVISFSIYLIHDPFRPLELALLRTIHPEPLGYFPALLMALVGSLSIIPFAWIAYGLVEHPGRVIFRSLFLGWTRARRPAAQND